MADRKISDLTALTTPASGDYLPIVDISEAAASDKNKRITIEELMRGVPDGTVGAPGIAFESDPNTGIYSPGADQVAVSTNGVGRLFVDSAGLAGLGNSSPGALLHVTRTNSGVDSETVVIQNRADASGTTASIYFSTNTAGTGVERSAAIKAICPASSSTANDLAFYTNVTGNAPSERLRITSTGQLSHIGGGSTGSPAVGFNGSAPSNSLVVDSSGRLLVGTASSLLSYSKLQVQGGAGVDPGAHICLSNENSAPSSGSNIGSVRFTNNAGGIGAVLGCEADGAWTAGSDYRSRLVFSVTADGAASPTEALRISNDRAITVSDGGNVVLGTTTGTKIGTATTQKLGFYNATPVVQPAAVADATDAATVITQLNDLLAKLRTLGIIAT
jgi:hypothetical protein